MEKITNTLFLHSYFFLTNFLKQQQTIVKFIIYNLTKKLVVIMSLDHFLVFEIFFLYCSLAKSYCRPVDDIHTNTTVMMVLQVLGCPEVVAYLQLSCRLVSSVGSDFLKNCPELTDPM
jgi:membrane-associated PAP2 superfamily phosphatase